ncbi:MAG: L-histidine N(alpha)-methyltransferase [Nanoarchaeota archaeon]
MITPASQRYVALFLAAADLSQAKTIVELGSGTGAVTEKILENKPKDSLFFSMEINKEFIAMTKKRCHRAIVYHDSALHLKKYLHQHHVRSCDIVISTLPLGGWKKDAQEKMLDTIHDTLSPKGKLFIGAYLHALLFNRGRNLCALLHEKFHTIRKTKTTFASFPPALVYCCQK